MRKFEEIIVDWRPVVVSTQGFSICNQLRVMVGTNCPQGGGRGHGGRTVLSLEDPDGDFRSGVDGASPESEVRIGILAGRDSDFDSSLDSFEFAVETSRLLRRAHCSRDGKLDF